VRTAEDGEQAYRLSDVMMPHRNGQELVRDLRGEALEIVGPEAIRARNRQESVQVYRLQIRGEEGEPTAALG
jgi:CheY-like chemotaxis protein